MTTISAAQVKELREATNVGMMECKNALVEAGGDKDEAIKILRERGLAIAGKKASRSANEGLIASAIWDDAGKGILLEVNCETDFVAKNENFQAFVGELVEKAKEQEGDLAEAVKDDLTAKITEIGENIVLGRSVRYELEGTGIIASYIHLGGKVGVLVEAGCGKEETRSSEVFQDAVKDVTLHIAASNPDYLNRDEVPADVLDAEKAIFAKQAEGKPENIVEKIVGGKIDKYLSQICLLEQEFVKDTDLSVAEYLEKRGKEVDDAFTIRRFARLQIGA